MDEFESELLFQVYEDIDHLREAAKPPFSSDTPRRLSNELRRLLIEGRLQSAWKALGNSRTPIIRAAKMHDFCKQPDGFSLSQGAYLNGYFGFGGFTVSNREVSDQEIADYAKSCKDLERYPFSLNEFLNSTSIWYKNHSISRRNVILYVAVKMGGVHFDTMRSEKDRDKTFSLIDEILVEGLYFGGFSESEIYTSHADEIFERRPENSTGAIGAEIISICQSLSSSDDVIDLQSQIREVVDFSSRYTI